FADLFVDSDGFDNGGATSNTPGFYADTTEDSGLAASLDRAIERLFARVDGANGLVIKGVFDTRKDKYNSDIRRYDQQIDSKQTYIDQFEDTPVHRFAKLEELIGGLNSQGASLQAGLAGLG